MLLRVLEISKVFVCILKCMYIMLCSIISVRQQPNVALYVIRANKDILYCIVLMYPTVIGLRAAVGGSVAKSDWPGALGPAESGSAL